MLRIVYFIIAQAMQNYHRISATVLEKIIGVTILKGDKYKMPNSNSNEQRIFASLEKNLAELRNLFGDSQDLNIAKVNVSGIKCAVVTIEGMVAPKDLSKMLFDPIMEYKKRNAEPMDVYKFFTEDGIFSNDEKIVNLFSEAAEYLCSGFALVFVHGVARGAAFGAQGFAIRSLSEPSTESNVKGAKESFNENLRTNMSLIRRRVKNPKLRFEYLKAGETSKTVLCMVYIDGKTPKALREMVKKGVHKMKLDMVLTTGNVEPYISSNKGSFFSSVSTTERPDVVASKINEGRIAIIIDGVPFVLVCPSLFIENFQTVDDYTEKPYYASYLRWIRFGAFFIASLLPGLYLAAATHHPEVLARALLLNLIANAEATPYSLFSEMVIVILMFEILKEAGLRLPKTIGGAVSIVGGLVIGDAAVTSGLISAPLLIVIGITATSSFVVPSLNAQTTILRFLNVILGGFFGFFGIAVLTATVLVNACVTDSFAVPYTAPMFPFTVRAMRDTITRRTFLKMEKYTAKINELNGAGGEGLENAD